MTGRYGHGWTDPRNIIATFGDAPIRREGDAVDYDLDHINKHDIEVAFDTGEIVNDDDDVK